MTVIKNRYSDKKSANARNVDRLAEPVEFVVGIFGWEILRPDITFIFEFIEQVKYFFEINTAESRFGAPGEV